MRLRHNQNQLYVGNVVKCGHKKKDCMAILFCTNCSRNNHTTSKCRQVFKENCTYCKQNDHTEELCSVKELDSMRQSQTREFHMYHSERPRTQLSTGAPRIEKGEILRRNQHQRAQQTVEKESTDKLTSYCCVAPSPKYKSKSKTTSHCHLLLHDCTNVAV